MSEASDFHGNEICGVMNFTSQRNMQQHMVNVGSWEDIKADFHMMATIAEKKKFSDRSDYIIWKPLSSDR